MQYKIPVQIEQADNIIFGLSLKQLGTLVVGWGISYSLFTSLAESYGWEIAIIPSGTIGIITLTIALINVYEMTFLPLILSYVRFNVNLKERSFLKWIDSFQPIEIWFVSSNDSKTEKSIDFDSKIDKIKSLDDQLQKI